MLSLIERRRRLLRARLLKEHPHVREHLEQKQEILERRLQKQNPEGLRKTLDRVLDSYVQTEK